MARTTALRVSEIVETIPTISLLPFIAAANTMVNWLATKDTLQELDSTTLEEIERWLAAHFYSCRDQAYQAKSIGRTMGHFQGQTTMVLASTMWGQQAMLLDVTGRLGQRSKDAETGLRRVASLDVLDQDPTTFSDPDED